MSLATVVCVTTDATETRDDLAFGKEDLFDIPGATFETSHDLENEEEYEERVADFLTCMKRIGAKVDYQAQSFTITEEVVQNHFAKRFTKLRELVNKLTPSQFASNSDGSLWSIKDAIEEIFED